MTNKIKSKKGGLPAQAGFLQIIIVIIIALLLMRYFNLTFSSVLAYFHLSWTDVTNWLQEALNWLKDLFSSVAK